MTDPSTRELFFRWTALGAYTPVMRTSMGANSRANWRWDSDAGTITQFRRYALQHLRLLPYLKALHREAMETGLPAMRHVLLEFPGWPGAARAHHSFLLGSALFVAPVVEQGAASREVELPPGRWFDFADATVHDGPATVEVEAELSDIPVFLREGTMVPMLGLKVRGVDAPTLEVARQTASEALAEHVDIHVGYARRAATELADGTSIRLLRARAEFASAGVRYESDGTDLAACTLGQKPQTHDCFAPSADGRILLAPRTGPGSLLLGRAATGRDPVGVVITGGSDDRRYVIRLYGVQVGGEGR